MKKYRELMLRIIPVVLVIGLTIGVSEAFYQRMIASTTENCWKEMTMAHSEASREISTRLRNNIGMLELGADAIVMKADLQEDATVQAYLTVLANETIFDRIDVLFPDGTTLVGNGERVPNPDEPTVDQLAAKGSHMSRRMTDPHTGQHVIHVYAPVHDASGEMNAILDATLRCETLANLFRSAHYGEDAQLYMVDRRDGCLVMDERPGEPGSIYGMDRYQASEEYTGLDFISDIMFGHSGKLAYVSPDTGITSYTVYAPVEGTDFTLTLVVESNVILADVNELKDTMMIVGAVEVVLLALFAVWYYFILRRYILTKNRAQQAELALLQQKEKVLERQYAAAADRQAFLETMAIHLPGGYHRCTADELLRVTFISSSFTHITGYTLAQLQSELGGCYMNLVVPEDRAYVQARFANLCRDKHVDCAYRMRRRDGSICWIQENAQYVERDGEAYCQCAIVDIHDIILKQEKLARQANLLDTLEKNMPGGYHRCADEPGWPFLYISSSFEEVTGWTREEITDEFGNCFINMVLPEDVPLCAGIVDNIQQGGYSNAMYRLKKKGGGFIWVADSTMRVETEGGVFYHGVLADVTGQMEEIEQAKQQAEASSRAKSTFLFNISHDIRTPMNAIRGFSCIIQENPDDPVLVQESIGKIRQAGDSLLLLMDDVLDIARIERGKDEVDLRPMDLCEHSKNLYEMFAADMKAAGIRFIPAGDELNDHVYCDRLKLTRIMMNMLSNARKFTPAGGTVTFGGERLRRDADTCTYRFFVRDTGIGMSPEFRKRAFEQFERERTSTQSGVSGSGLGLAIIKMLVELMGGTVELRSELGKGTEISATLTLRLADPEQMAPTGDGQDAPDLAGRRVLLVEDNDFNREIARYVLERMHCTVEEAVNGAVCLEKLMNAPPGYYDLILMDIQMPVMDGYTAAAEIRNLNDPVKAAVPILAMTANAFEEDRRRCLAAGMNGHLAKPFQMDDLANALRSLVKRDA